MNIPKPLKWKKFSRKEHKMNPISLKTIFGDSYTLHRVGTRVIDGYRELRRRV